MSDLNYLTNYSQRGIIFHGPPGNGKTISIRAIMKELANRSSLPVASLYVKSFTHFNPEYGIRRVFQKARETAPCLLIFEDVDSLVTPSTRSYFLNEVDGLEKNDGVLMLGSTNHCVYPPSLLYNLNLFPAWSISVQCDELSFTYECLLTRTSPI